MMPHQNLEQDRPVAHDPPPTLNTPLMQGTMVTDPESVRAAYQLGDFRYQFLRKGKSVSRIMTCTNPHELDWLAKRVNPSNPIVISLGR